MQPPRPRGIRARQSRQKTEGDRENNEATLHLVLHLSTTTAAATAATTGQPLHPGTGALLHNERAIAGPEEPTLHLEFYQRDVTGDMRLLLNILVDVISKSCQEIFTAVNALENKV